MHSFVHHHRETSEAQTGSTQGWVMNMGWRYDLMVWFFDTFLYYNAGSPAPNWASFRLRCER
jgi:hypothetical protein